MDGFMNLSGYSFRWLKACDLELLPAFAEEYLASGDALHVPYDEIERQLWELKDWNPDEPSSYFYGGFDKDGALVSVCSAGGAEELDGMFDGMPPVKDNILLSDVYVLPRCRRQGVGTCMLETLFDRLTAERSKAGRLGDSGNIYLSAFDEAAEEFYKSLGFIMLDDLSGIMAAPLNADLRYEQYEQTQRGI